MLSTSAAEGRKSGRALYLLLHILCLKLLPPLLAVVELGEAVTDDGDGQPNHQNPEDCAEAAEDLAEAGDRTDVSVSYLEHDWVKIFMQIECVTVRLMSALYTVTSRLQHDAKYVDELII